MREKENLSLEDKLEIEKGRLQQEDPNEKSINNNSLSLVADSKFVPLDKN